MPIDVSNDFQTGHNPDDTSWSSSAKSVHEQVCQEEWPKVVGPKSNLQVHLFTNNMALTYNPSVLTSNPSGVFLCSGINTPALLIMQSSLAF